MSVRDLWLRAASSGRRAAARVRRCSLARGARIHPSTLPATIRRLFRLNYRFSSAFCVVEEWVRSGALHGAIMRIKPAADAAYAWALQHLQAAGSDALPAQPKYNDAYNVLCFCAGQEMAGGRGGTGAAGAAAVAAMAKDPLVREVEAPGGWGHTGTTFGYTAVDTPTHLDE